MLVIVKERKVHSWRSERKEIEEVKSEEKHRTRDTLMQ